MSTDKPVTRFNQTDFANKLGIKRQAINNAVGKGLLVKHGKGRAAYIDMTCPKTVAYIKNASSNRYRGKVGGDARTPRKAQSTPIAASPEKKAPEPVPPSPETIASAEAYMDKQEIERQKKLEETVGLKIKNSKARGELVERTTVQEFIDSMHVIDNGQWRTLGLRVSSDVAALLGIDDDDKIRDMAEVIDKAAFKTLKQVKREQNKFLKRIGGVAIFKNKIDLSTIYQEMAQMLKDAFCRQ